MTMTIGTHYNVAKKQETVTLTVNWTSDAGGDASMSTEQYLFGNAKITDVIKGRSVTLAQTKPGTTPSADYDVVVNDANSADIFGGNLGNRSNSNAETVFPGNGTVYASIPVTGALTFVVSNAGNAKTGSIILNLE